MKYLLKDIQEYMENDDSFRRKAAFYSSEMKKNELAFLNEAILIIRGIMANDLFSFKHTNSDAFEKDVTQRTYYNINQILDFLANPEGWFRKKNRLQQAYTNIQEKVSGRFKSGGTK